MISGDLASSCRACSRPGTPPVKGVDRELRWKSGDAAHFATDGPAPRRYDGHTAAARVRVAVFVRRVNTPTRSSVAASPDFAALGEPRHTTAPSVACSSLRLKPGEQLLCCSHTLAQLTQPTVRLPQLSQRWARPHWPSVTCAAACVSDTARRLPAHCETMGVRRKTTLPALGHISPEVRSFSSVDGNTCLLAGAEQEGLAHNPCSTQGLSLIHI